MKLNKTTLATAALLTGGALGAHVSPAMAANGDTRTVTWRCPPSIGTCYDNERGYADIGISGPTGNECRVSWRLLTEGDATSHSGTDGWNGRVTYYNQVDSMKAKAAGDVNGGIAAVSLYDWGLTTHYFTERYRIDSGNCSFH